MYQPYSPGDNETKIRVMIYEDMYFEICYQRLEKLIVSISGQSNTLNTAGAHCPENTAKKKKLQINTASCFTQKHREKLTPQR